MRTSHLAACTLSIALLGSSVATADVFCGASRPNHDAPAGYLILSRANTTVIKGVIDALSEYRTHTMISHGSWFTHAVMRIPTTQTSAPMINTDQLRFGSPGASQITSQAAYTSLYDPANGGIEFISKQQGGTEAQDVAAWFWSSMGYRWVSNTCSTVGAGYFSCVGTYHPPPAGSNPRTNPGYTTYAVTPYYDCNGNLQTNTACVPVYSGGRGGTMGSPALSIRKGGGYYRLQEGGRDLPYSLHQFSNIGTVNTGSILSSSEGVVCSTLQAYGVKKALGRSLFAPTYSHTLTAAAMTELYNGVFKSCKDSDFGFFGSIIDWFAFGSISDSKCEQAANQAVNCLITPSSCGSSGTGWKSSRDNTAVRARSISPDGISGWRPGQDYNDTASYGPWAPFGYENLSFSGPGSTYSCWGN